MRFVVDTNIIISALISPSGLISSIIFRKLKVNQLIAPLFLYEEIINHQDKILKIAKYSSDQYFDLLYMLIKRIDFIDNKIIPENIKLKAYEMIKDIDIKDVDFLSVSLFTGLKIWTGDLKLLKGLKEKGFDNILSTKELVDKLNNY